MSYNFTIKHQIASILHSVSASAWAHSNSATKRAPEALQHYMVWNLPYRLRKVGDDRAIVLSRYGGPIGLPLSMPPTINLSPDSPFNPYFASLPWDYHSTPDPERFGWWCVKTDQTEDEVRLFDHKTTPWMSKHNWFRYREKAGPIFIIGGGAS